MQLPIGLGERWRVTRRGAWIQRTVTSTLERLRLLLRISPGPCQLWRFWVGLP
jgi:hypothetical protein